MAENQTPMTETNNTNELAVRREKLAALTAAGLDVPRALADNDTYHALQAVGGLIMTGPTGTNVNDVAVVLTE